MNNSASDHLYRAIYNRFRTWTFFFGGAIIVFASGCSTPDQQLIAAIDQGDPARVAHLLKSPQNLGGLDSSLVTAASKGENDIVRELLDAGAKSDSGEALNAAAKGGFLETSKLLLDRGADINKQVAAIEIRDSSLVSNNGQATATFRVQRVDGAGNNPLSSAILAKRVSVVRLLLERGADRKRTVVYKDAEQPGLMLDVFQMAMSGGNMQVIIGGGLFSRASGGTVTTNIRYDTDKSASIQELAIMSGDKEIIQLLPANSKYN